MIQFRSGEHIYKWWSLLIECEEFGTPATHTHTRSSDSFDVWKHHALLKKSSSRYSIDALHTIHLRCACWSMAGHWWHPRSSATAAFELVKWRLGEKLCDVGHGFLWIFHMSQETFHSTWKTPAFCWVAKRKRWTRAILDWQKLHFVHRQRVARKNGSHLR